MLEKHTLVHNGRIQVDTGLPWRTKVKVKIVADQIAEMALELGAKMAVSAALQETGLEIKDAKALEALEAFAKAVGGGRRSILENVDEYVMTVGWKGRISLKSKLPEGTSVTVYIDPA